MTWKDNVGDYYFYYYSYSSRQSSIARGSLKLKAIRETQPTLGKQRLNVVVVDLKRCITTAPRKSDNMIIVIGNFHSDIAQRQVVGSDVEHGKDVSLHLASDVEIIRMRFVPLEIQSITIIFIMESEFVFCGEGDELVRRDLQFPIQSNPGYLNSRS